MTIDPAMIVRWWFACKISKPFVKPAGKPAKCGAVLCAH